MSENITKAKNKTNN